MRVSAAENPGPHVRDAQGQGPRLRRIRRLRRLLGENLVVGKDTRTVAAVHTYLSTRRDQR